MRIEISKSTLEHLINKYPQLTDSIIQYFLFCGNIKREYIKKEQLNRFEYAYHSYHILSISEDLANEYDVDEELDLIPDNDGVIYKIHIDK
jgi:hypothetical protein